jgi:hypothetical protein
MLLEMNIIKYCSGLEYTNQNHPIHRISMTKLAIQQQQAKTAQGLTQAAGLLRASTGRHEAHAAGADRLQAAAAEQARGIGGGKGRGANKPK